MSGITALVLAGDRGAEDPVAAATGAPCKAFAPVAGRTLVERVTTTLAAVPAIDDVRLVGPSRAVLDMVPERWSWLEATGATWIEPDISPAASAAHALTSIPDDRPVLLTSVDHGLLQSEWVEQVLTKAHQFECTVALVPRAALAAAYPQAQPTTIRLGPGDGYCTANLFTVAGPAGRALVDRWRAFEAARKTPARYMARLLGWTGTLAYLCGRLTLEDARRHLAKRLDLSFGITEIEAAEAGLDVDTAADLQLAEQILAAREADA
ncbi:NTP transferase domain-containing protein [Salinisphaera sp. USBA-960]|uniref:nucleotidyltransferase family protein n=1 Tax=Salinisphaera orenii TaxID=856731 RepID=UPI000DBE60A7|nr:NTP transferase domain-containing protein [Salifodinibacter halophilus]NNC26750.1 NTP transferase domain-containing protein [Salifodinibacter halophilus]